MRKTHPRTSTHLAASRERTRSDRYSDRGRRRRDGYYERVGGRTLDNAEDDAHFDYDDAINYQSDSNSHHASDESSPDKPEEKASTFYSRKSLTDPSFSDDPHFYNLCNAAGLTRPSRIQIAYAYLLPLLQRIYQTNENEKSASQRKRNRL
jgi:hypothetical protein